MPDYRKILTLNRQGFSQRNIANICGCSRNTVKSTIERAAAAGLLEIPPTVSDEALQEALFPKVPFQSSREMPDFEHIHKELGRDGVTLGLLWREYSDACVSAGKHPYMYSHFSKLYSEYAVKNKATMRLQKKPGDVLEVDWAGQTMEVYDVATGEILKAYIFVATLPASKYTYVEAFLSMKMDAWIAGHVNAYRFFGGATARLVPDNLKTGVTKNTKSELVLNKTYSEMADHYGTVIIPARPRKPRDKAAVEGDVGAVSTAILAALRDQKMFTLAELNRAIRAKLVEFNRRDFQKREGSRESVFLEEEKPFLNPLPPKDFEISEWKTATVQFHYHISVDKMNYSVPHEFIKHKVEVRTTARTVEVFYRTKRIASHPRLKGKANQYSTLMEHMPPNHQSYLDWNGTRFLTWAKRIGPETETVIQSLLKANPIEQQAYKSCMSILKLGDKYGVARLEEASKKALMYTPKPSFKNISLILKNGQDTVPTDSRTPETIQNSDEFVISRGASYYGGDETC